MNPRSQAPSTRDLPRWLWLWFPPLIFIAHAITRNTDYETHDFWMRGEFGYTELATFGFLVIAMTTAVLAFLRRRQVREWYFGPLMLGFALGCLYFAGEEISWGHHWGIHPFGAEITQSLISTNDQEEPNFHNQGGLIGSLLDQWPRAMLTLAAVVGGVIVPIWSRKRAAGPITWPAAWLWPTLVCTPVAFFAATTTVPKKITEWFGGGEESYGGWGETKEYFIAMFLMMYALSLYLRLRRDALPGAGSLAPVHHVGDAGLGEETPAVRSRSAN